MSERHILKTDGAWVELRDVLDVRARERKKVMAIMTSAVQVTDLSTGAMDADPNKVMQAYQAIPETVAAMLITAWEIPYAPDAKLPHIDPDSIGDLRLDDYDRLMEITKPAMDLLMPNPVTPDDYADPTSPSEPVSD